MSKSPVVRSRGRRLMPRPGMSRLDDQKKRRTEGKRLRLTIKSVSRKQTIGHKWTHSQPAIMTLTAVLIAGIFTIYAAQMSAKATLGAAISQQQAASDAARSEEARKKRGEIYATLLDSAALFSDYVAGFQGRKSEFYADPANERKIYSATLQEAEEQNKYRSDFQSRFNQAYIYASDEGYAAAERLYSVFRDSGATLSLRWHLHPSIDLNLDRYNAAYDDLRKLMCREASAKPRKECS